MMRAQCRHEIADAVVLSVILILVSLDASAVGIGVSPGTVDFDNVLKMGYAEKTITVSTSSSESIECAIKAEGPFSEWLNYSTGKEFTLPPRSQIRLVVMVNPPGDAPNGLYSGFITISVIPKSISGGGMGSALTTAVSLRSSVTVSDVENKHYHVKDISSKDTEERTPIEITLSVENDGNVRLYPDIRVDILTEDKSVLLKSVRYSEKMLLPTRRDSILITIPNNLSIGKYSAKVTAYLDGQIIAEQTLDFEVLEKGSLRIQGQLQKVELNKIWVYSGELVEVKASFKNDGVLSTPAVFKGKATLDDEVIELIQSEEIEIPAGQGSDLIAYFIPKKPGRYSIIGRVYYSKKVTAEKSSILNVKETEATTTTMPAKGSGDLGSMLGGTDPMVVGAAAVLLVLVMVLFFVMGKKKGNRTAREESVGEAPEEMPKHKKR